MTARVRAEDGAYAVLYAVLTVVLFLFAALVIDLGGVRLDVRANQTVADNSATAGAAVLDPMKPVTAVEACVKAWQYFLANSPGAGSAPHPCATFQGMPLCTTSTTPRRAVGTAGSYRVTLTYPVPPGDPLLRGRSSADFDGRACERLGVEVTRTRGFAFAGLLGATEGAGTSAAVARNGGSGNTSRGISMLILDPTGCNALVAKGQAQAIVNASGGMPGIIAVDSSATETNPASGQNDRNCSNAGWYAIDAVGTQNSKISTNAGVDPLGSPIDGEIYSYAMMPGQNNAQAYDPADVAAGRVAPPPVAHERITRRPVDQRYNCQAANLCPDAGARAAEIDGLRSLVGGSGRPPGFNEYPADVPLAKCSIPPSNPPIALVGNWWINCSKLDVSTAFSVTGGNVVFQGTANVGSAGVLSINAGGNQDRWVYFRNGNLEKDAQAAVILDRTFVYLHNGTISLGAGSGVLRWISPFAGPFEDLAMWSESTLTHLLGGQANLEIEGVFFAPNAYPFRFSGQGQQQQAKAQFITHRLEITGQGVLMLSVDPERSVKVPLSGVKLIR